MQSILITLLSTFNMYCKLLTIALADYTSKSVDLMFGPSSRKRCLFIPVTNDTVPEVPEHFSVVLSMTAPLAGVVLTPDDATVVINDDDGECYQFGSLMPRTCAPPAEEQFSVPSQIFGALS